jgi:hypothetical protein
MEDRFEERTGTTTGNTVTFPGFQMTRRASIGDPKYGSIIFSRLLERFLQLWAKLVQGLVLGGMRTLGVECEVDALFVANQVSENPFINKGLRAQVLNHDSGSIRANRRVEYIIVPSLLP